MCGVIAAFGIRTDVETAVRRGMDRMNRRGPDAEGYWEEPGAALGHRRLAIIDLDARAAQPMTSQCGRYVVALNGEIYNYRDLREVLARNGICCRTTSDTEALLELFALEGPDMLSRLEGMFAFVIWDRVAKRGFAARDPYGIKPLYYAAADEGVIVASQVRAIIATGRVSTVPNPVGQAGFWMLGSVPEPHSWFVDIHPLPPGHSLWIEKGQVATPECWMDITAAWRNAPVAAVSREDAAALVRVAVRESVGRHLTADVPVGVFLSGGIDSGAVAGLMAEAGGRDIAGVTLAYEEFAGGEQDEVPAAAMVAAHYRIHHHVRVVSRDEFNQDLPRIIEAMDQPTIDGINTWYASKAAAELGLKVVVSGVGGDELFQGYESFRTLPPLVRHWRAASRVRPLSALGSVAGRVQAWRSGNGRWRFAASWARTISGAWWLRRSLFAPDELARVMDPAAAKHALRGFDVHGWVEDMAGTLSDDARLALSQIESRTYLRNQLLRDSDWASMDHGVELRTPLVDARLLATLNPVITAFSTHSGKKMLAAAPIRGLPREVSSRRKTGFGIPVAKWLADEGTGRGGSQRWAVSLVPRWENSLS